MNVPMSYAGPPVKSEIRCNRNRNDQSRSSIAMNSQENYCNIIVPQQKPNADERRSRGEAMSYSPPRSGSPEARRRGHPKWRDENIDPKHNYPLQMTVPPQKQKNKRSRHQPNKASFDPHRVDPAKSNQIRYNYDNGQSKLPKAKQPHRVRNA